MLIRKRERESLVLFSDMVNVSIVRLNKAPLQIILLLYFKFHCMVVCIYFIPNFHISSKLLQELTERESERERETNHVRYLAPCVVYYVFLVVIVIVVVIASVIGGIANILTSQFFFFFFSSIFYILYFHFVSFICSHSFIILCIILYVENIGNWYILVVSSSS